MKKQELYCKFWDFYYHKFDNDFDKAAEAIRKLDLTEMHVFSAHMEKFVYIRLRRPGRLIGLRGNNIQELQQHLNMKLCVVEEKTAVLSDNIIPYREYYDTEDLL